MTALLALVGGWRALMLAVPVALVAWSAGSWFGAREQARLCTTQMEVEALRAAAAASRADLDAAHAASRRMSEAAVTENAARLSAEQRLRSYEDDLRARGDAGRCTLDDRDAGRLSDDGLGAARPPVAASR